MFQFLAQRSEVRSSKRSKRAPSDLDILNEFSNVQFQKKDGKTQIEIFVSTEYIIRIGLAVKTK